MDILQNTFKEDYYNDLKLNIEVSNYRQNVFPYDKTKVKPIGGVYHPNNLLDKLDVESDLNTGIALYESFDSLTPLIASSEAFWAYLTHVDCYSYVKKKYPLTGEDEEDKKIIKDHWFYNGAQRTTLYSLWWSVYNTVDKSRGESHKYDLTELFFKGFDLRVNRLGISTLFRNKEALIGILSFLYNNEDLCAEYYNPRTEYITVYFNRLGAVKQLQGLKRDFFIRELEKRKNFILSIKDKADVRNNPGIFSI